MKKEKIYKKLIAEALLKEEKDITPEDLQRLQDYITENYAKNNQVYFWYLDGSGKEAVADANGNIIYVEDTADFFRNSTKLI